MPIVRQSSKADIPEIIGSRCERFVGVQYPNQNTLEACYIRLDGTWHQIVIHSTVLYWEGGEAPFPDNDLDDGEVYRDLGRMYGTVGKLVSRAQMSKGVFYLGFGDFELRFAHTVDEESVQISKHDTDAEDIS